jgi:PII-like signaling protein
MLSLGSARKVTVYLNEDSSSKETFTYEQVVQFLYEQEVAGATLIRPEQGFGNRHQGTSVTRMHLPVRIEFIDSPNVVEAILPALCELVSDGLVEVQETTIVKAAKQAGAV